MHCRLELLARAGLRTGRMRAPLVLGRALYSTELPSTGALFEQYAKMCTSGLIKESGAQIDALSQLQLVYNNVVSYSGPSASSDSRTPPVSAYSAPMSRVTTTTKKSSSFFSFGDDDDDVVESRAVPHSPFGAPAEAASAAAATFGFSSSTVDKPRGLYLYGGTGCGKTMMVLYRVKLYYYYYFFLQVLSY